MNKKLKAFTLAETLIVIVVIAIMVTITVLSTLNLDEAKEKKILSTSQNFYLNVNNSYLQILFNETSNGSVINLKDSNGDSSIDSNDLRNYFAKYMDGENTSCSDLKVGSSVISEYLNNAQCAIFTPNIIAGFYFDKNCSLEISAKEYLSDNHDTKTINNACGVITYGLSDAKGNFTYDIFTIALGKRGVK